MKKNCYFLEVGTKLAGGGIVFFNKMPAAVLFFLSIFIFSCTPLSVDNLSVPHNVSGAESFDDSSDDEKPGETGTEENGQRVNTVENQLAGSYSDDNHIIIIRTNQTGKIQKNSDGSFDSQTANNSLPNLADFKWTRNGTTIGMTFTYNHQTINAVFHSDQETLTIDGFVYKKLPSMDDTAYIPPSDVSYLGSYSTTINDNAFFGSVMHPAVKGGDALDVPLKFVIVSDAKFQTALQEYIKHKRRQGYNVVEIYRNGETAEQLRQKIIDEHYVNATAKNPSPSYVLLCGDHENLPAFSAKTLDLGKPYYTDYHYGEYNDDWVQDAMVGRFSAKNETELQAQINKTMHMETKGSATTNKYISVGMKDADQTQWVADYVAKAGVNGEVVDWEPASKIVEKINSGLGFVFHAGHSGEIYWAGKGGYGTSLSSYHASTLSNTDNYPFFISMSCYSATFAYPYGRDGQDCLGEALMKNANGGAVGYIGATITSKAAVNPMVSQGWRYWETSKNEATYTPDSLGAVAALYHSRGESKKYWARSMGEVLYSGIRAIELQYKEGAKGYLSRRYHEIYVLLGDPSYMPYTDVAKPATINVNGTAHTGRALTITTAPFARLALTRENAQGKIEIIAVTVSDEFGLAVMQIPDTAETGNATLTAIAQNYYMTTQQINIEKGAGAKDSDATLEKLTVQKFDSEETVVDINLTGGKFVYKYEMPYETEVIKVSAVANKNTSAVYGSTGTIPLAVGDNNIVITVRAENGTTNTYTLNLVRKDSSKSRDYSIKTLKINNEIVAAKANEPWHYDYNYGDKTLLTLEVEMSNGNAKCWLQDVTDAKTQENKAKAKNTLRCDIDLNNNEWTSAYKDVIYVDAMSEFGDETYSFTIKLTR